MQQNTYFKFGMSVLDTIVEHYEALNENRPNIAEMIQRLSVGHQNVINKYGSSQALNAIFASEITDYYEATIGIKEEMTTKILSGTMDSLATNDDYIPQNCLILYPSFVHQKRDDAIAHIPVVRGYILDGNAAKKVEVDYGKYDQMDNRLDVSQDASKLIMEIASEVVREWTAGYRLSYIEEKIIIEEVVVVILFENSQACREEILRNVIEDTNLYSLEKLLKNKL